MFKWLFILMLVGFFVSSGSVIWALLASSVTFIILVPLLIIGFISLVVGLTLSIGCINF
ncbi:hypothetical protein [Paraferrimonas sp. SM1919]|uniref:hypothetical protein n=1 Tax=Paraferrimonas sp. SM1919 TaxID=2662263 RepID=UPI0013D15025|nr:hypothetical protein [Paraferrimonas sp. SM1919]